MMSKRVTRAMNHPGFPVKIRGRYVARPPGIGMEALATEFRLTSHWNFPGESFSLVIHEAQSRLKHPGNARRTLHHPSARLAEVFEEAKPNGNR